MIQIYYGFGKGKTSALNGAAIRAHGANLKVGYFRFLKGIPSSENDVLNSIGILINTFHSGTKFVYQMNELEKQKIIFESNDGLNKVISLAENYDVILLDELLDLIDTKLKTETELIQWLVQLKKACNNNQEIIITGHNKYVNLFQMADLITYFSAEKHYFNAKVKARKGFEY